MPFVEPDKLELQRIDLSTCCSTETISAFAAEYSIHFSFKRLSLARSEAVRSMTTSFVALWHLAAPVAELSPPQSRPLNSTVQQSTFGPEKSQGR